MINWISKNNKPIPRYMRHNAGRANKYNVTAMMYWIEKRTSQIPEFLIHNKLICDKLGCTCMYYLFRNRKTTIPKNITHSYDYENFERLTPLDYKRKFFDCHETKQVSLPKKTKCTVCEKMFYCPCQDELSIRPKYRTCVINNGKIYPQSMLDSDCKLIHMCSYSCGKKYQKKQEDEWKAKGYNVVHIGEYSLTYYKDSMTEEEALAKLRESIKI